MPGKDAQFVDFLQWALPRLRMRWQGFRKVRGQVARRLIRRVEALDLPGLSAYRSYLESHPEEWTILDGLSRVTISCFYRDKAVFRYLEDRVLPDLAQLAASDSERCVRCWSIGAAAGEEPYSLAILWKLRLAARFPAVSLRILATDADAGQLARARIACYSPGSVKEISPDLRRAAFEQRGERFCLRPQFQSGVEFRQQDIRQEMPGETFHLVLCRNLVFTYFDEQLQAGIARALHCRLVAGGVLVLGKRERLPPDVPFTSVPSMPLWLRM